jgi:hypothetical protein
LGDWILFLGLSYNITQQNNRFKKNKKNFCVRTCEYCFINAIENLFYMFQWNARVVGYLTEKKEQLEIKKKNLSIFDEIISSDY